MNRVNDALFVSRVMGLSTVGKRKKECETITEYYKLTRLRLRQLLASDTMASSVMVEQEARYRVCRRGQCWAMYWTRASSTAVTSERSKEYSAEQLVKMASSPALVVFADPGSRSRSKRVQHAKAISEASVRSWARNEKLRRRMYRG